jgi:hypothetical protein
MTVTPNDQQPGDRGVCGCLFHFADGGTCSVPPSCSSCGQCSQCCDFAGCGEHQSFSRRRRNA